MVPLLSPYNKEIRFWVEEISEECQYLTEMDPDIAEAKNACVFYLFNISIFDNNIEVMDIRFIFLAFWQHLHTV